MISDGGRVYGDTEDGGATQTQNVDKEEDDQEKDNINVVHVDTSERECETMPEEKYILISPIKTRQTNMCIVKPVFIYVGQSNWIASDE
jgi:hypothetical protein